MFKRPNGYKYRGFWEFDLKHGKGIEIFSDESKICSNWNRDRIHGKGTYKVTKEKGGHKLKKVWNLDLMIEDNKDEFG